MTTECTLVHVEKAEMIEVDENDKIETVILVRLILTKCSSL